MAGNVKIGFLGSGKMATALAQGFLRAGLVSPAECLASDINESAREGFASATQVSTTASNTDVARFASTLVLAVKPGQVEGVLSGIRECFTKDHLLVSIAAGVTLAKLEAALPAGARVVRAMPNTPALVGSSATAYALGAAALPGTRKWPSNFSPPSGWHLR